MSQDILEKVQTIVAEQLGLEKDQVKSTANFSTELGADSLDVVELVMALEEAFEVEIADDEAASIATVQDAVNYIAGNTK